MNAPRVLGVVLVAAACSSVPAVGVVISPADPPPKVIVQFAAGSSASQRTQAMAAVDALDHDAITGLPRMQVIDIPDGQSPAAAARELRSRPGVQWAAADGWAHVLTVPNDPDYPSLWGMPAIGAPTVWDTARGSASVPVGVVDTGLSSTHPDLIGNEIAALGRNFVPPGGSADTTGTPIPTAWDDVGGHGTHVGGTIGAVGNNGIGVTGVNWMSGLFAARAMDIGGRGSDSSITDAFAWAASRARVVNASLGGPTAVPAWETVFRTYPNTLFVVAAGNDGENNDDPQKASFPCASTAPNVLCVAALDRNNDLAGFSNWGPTSVDIGAPGKDINSTYIPTEARDDQSSAAAMATWARSPNVNPSAWVAGDLDGFPYVITNGTRTPVGGELTSIQMNDLPPLTGSACRAEMWVAGVKAAGVDAAFVVQAKASGGSWADASVPLDFNTGGKFGRFTADLTPWSGQAGVKMRLAVTTGGTDPVDLTLAEGANATYLAVGGLKASCMVPQPAAGTYAVESGTSMAAPHVAGAAAMLLSLWPDLTAAQVKNALLSSATPTPSLAGKTVTGGRLNLAAAIAALTPPVVTPAPAPAQAAAPPAAAPPTVGVPSGTITRRVVKGRVSLPLSCTAPAAGRCVMTITLLDGRRTIGTIALTVPTGWSGSKAVPLNAAGRRALASRGRVNATIRVAPRNGAPGATSTGRVRIVGR